MLHGLIEIYVYHIYQHSDIQWMEDIAEICKIRVCHILVCTNLEDFSDQTFYSVLSLVSNKGVLERKKYTAEKWKNMTID